MSEKYPRYPYTNEPDVDLSSRAFSQRFPTYDHAKDEPDLDFITRAQAQMLAQYPNSYRVPEQSPQELRKRKLDRFMKKAKRWIGLVAAGAVLGAGAGFMDGARRAMPSAMEGTVTAEKAEAKVYELEDIGELYVLRARVGISTAVKFEGHPFGVDAQAFGGAINFNAEKTLRANDVKRDVRKGFQFDEIMKYDYDPNKALVSDGGDPEDPAVTMDVDLGKVITVVSEVPEIRDNDFDPSVNGVLGWVLEVLQVGLDQEFVKNAIGENANKLDAAGKLDNLLAGTLRVYINETAAKACMETDKNDATKSLLVTRLIEAVKKIIIEDMSKRHPDLKLTADDINLNVTDPQFDGTFTTSDTDSGKKKDALTTLTAEPKDVMPGFPVKFDFTAIAGQVPGCEYTGELTDKNGKR